jgi:DNA-binding MarR family transcriptional regulator
VNAKSSPTHSSRYQALLQVLRTADTLWNASRLFFARWELSPSQFNILNLLSDQPEGLSQIELGRLLITHRSNVTGLVDRLEARGLVARKNVVGDRRAYRVILTADARRLLNEILPEFHQLAETIWSGTTTRRVGELTEDLARLSARAEQLTRTEDDT